MRTYLDIDTFSEWTSEEQYQFSLAVTKGLIMDMVRKAILAIVVVRCHLQILPKFYLQNI